MKLPYPLDGFGFKITSQNNEDGIIDTIIKYIPTTEYFVEIGCDPHESNCLQLKAKGWDGLFIDYQKQAPWIKNEWVSAQNITELIVKYQVPINFGVLSIDIDGQDFWVWRELTAYQPTLVVIEYNGKLAIDHDFVIPRQDDFMIQSHLYGASLLTMNAMAERKGYTLVYANGVNAFFVRSYMIENRYDFQYRNIYRSEIQGAQWNIQDPLKMGFIRWRDE